MKKYTEYDKKQLAELVKRTSEKNSLPTKKKDTKSK